MNAKDAGADVRQNQFLKVQTREECIAIFAQALQPRPLGSEAIPLDRLVGRVLAEDLHAAVDAPPFDRSVVDGFAVRSADLAKASQSNPAHLTLNGEDDPLRSPARAPGRTGQRDADRHRRPDPARRRCGGDDRAYGQRRRGRHQCRARRGSGAEHLLRGLGYRQRPDLAACRSSGRRPRDSA